MHAPRIAALAALLTMYAAPAFADEGDEAWSKMTGWWLQPGVTLAGVQRDGEEGMHFAGGVETSLVFFSYANTLTTPSFKDRAPLLSPWGGMYVDALYDSGIKRMLMSFGPELGVGMAGMDGGLAWDPGGKRFGWTARVLLTGSVVDLYLRIGEFPSSDESRSEFGVIFKFPVPIGRNRAPWWSVWR